MQLLRTVSCICLLFLPVAASSAAETRDPWLWPFASDSIWNMPIGSEAKFVPAGLEAAKTIDLDIELLYRIAPGAPERKQFAPLSWETRAGGTKFMGKIPLNDDIIVADARKGSTPNNCAAFLMPDGRTLKHVGAVCRPVAGGPLYGYPFRPDTDLFGDGIFGSHGASRMSALGGSIRLGELTNDQPIRHALKVDIYCKKFCYYGDDRPGYRWPATAADSYAKNEYRGKNRAVVMGSLLAIPGSVKEADLKLKTRIGKKLFAALQDYGAYVVDDAAWDAHYLCAEQGVMEELEKQDGARFDATNRDLFQDINTLFTALHVVDNNSHDRSGGGGKPRVALAPPLAKKAADPPAAHPAPLAEPLAAAPASEKATAIATPAADFKLKVNNGEITDGEAEPKHWTSTWTANGKITVARDTEVFHSKPAALRVSSQDGHAKGQTMQAIEAEPGQKFRLRAAIRAAGDAKAILGVQSYTKDWKGIEFKAVGAALPGFDWQIVEDDITLPANTARFGIVLQIDGDGQAWLDDVTIGPATGEKPATKASTSKDKIEPKQVTKPKPLVEAPPKAPNSTTPGQGFYKDYPTAWQQVLNGQLARAKQGKIDVVLLGDSITQGWDKELYQKHFEPRNTVNFGVGGDGTPQLRWRIKEGILDGYQAKLVVLMVGVNNTWPGYTADDTGDGVIAVVKAIREKQPQAKILLVGTFHFFDKDSRKRIDTINAKAKTMDDGRMVRFVDLSDKYLEANGDLKMELYNKDKIHLSKKGYEVWAAALEPHMKELLQENKPPTLPQSDAMASSRLP